MELLRAKVDVKKAELAGMQALLDEATKQWNRIWDLREKGTSSQQEVSKAKLALERQTADVKVKEAELAEAMVLLKQAERRVKGGVGSVAPSRTTEQRLADLEKQVAELRDIVKRSGLGAERHKAP